MQNNLRLAERWMLWLLPSLSFWFCSCCSHVVLYLSPAKERLLNLFSKCKLMKWRKNDLMKRLVTYYGSGVGWSYWTAFKSSCQSATRQQKETLIDKPVLISIRNGFCRRNRAMFPVIILEEIESLFYQNQRGLGSRSLIVK